MKNRTLKHFFATLLLLCTTTISAQNFKTGGICYNILDSTTLTVEVIPDILEDDFSYYEGDIIIPAQVNYNGINYNVTTIGEYAFYDCTNLTSVTIPNSVITIKYNAFTFCNFYKLIIPNSVTTIEAGAFYNCHFPSKFIIPNSVTNIEENAFAKCFFYELIISNGIINIKEGAFYQSDIKKLTIGKSVKNIEDYAFSGCDDIKEVYCLTTELPNTGRYAFKDSYVEYIDLYVPEEAIDSYRNNHPWKNFYSINPIETYNPDTSYLEKCATPIITYNKNKLNIACDTEGAQFVTTITDSDIRTHYDSTIELTVTYNITTYATLAGYENSDTIQASLCWIDSTPTMEQIGTDISKIASTPVLVRSSNGNIFVSGATEGTAIRIYSADGMNVGSAVSSEGETAIPTTLQKGKIAIVAIGNSRIKMVVR